MNKQILKKLTLYLLVGIAIVGAYFFGLTKATHPTQPQYVRDDLNKDGQVNISDLSLFLSHYPKTTPQ